MGKASMFAAMNERQMQLLAERKFLEERLAALPATSRITRISTESRLKYINEQIGQCVSMNERH